VRRSLASAFEWRLWLALWGVFLTGFVFGLALALYFGC